MDAPHLLQGTGARDGRGGPRAREDRPRGLQARPQGAAQPGLSMAGAKGTVLLTGGSGMVGRNVAEFPAASGWKLVAPGSRELDLRDAQATADFVRKLQPDVIIHAAG